MSEKSFHGTNRFSVSVLLVMLTAAMAIARAQASAPKDDGEFLKRSTMSGDWGGLRTAMAEKAATRTSLARL